MAGVDEHIGIGPAQRRPQTAITPRDLHFAIEGGRTSDWLGGDVVGSAVFNAFSLMLPEGERLFMDAVREYRWLLAGRLLEEAQAFMAQEAVHAREHRSLNSLVDRRRYPVAAIEAQMREQMARVRDRGPMVMLRVTIALEHFTSLLADVLLGEDSLLADAPPDMARLWQWHAMEEFEHRTVAFDVFVAATEEWTPLQRLWARNVMMIVVSVVFVAALTGAAMRLLVADGMDQRTARLRVLWFLFGAPGPLRRCWLPFSEWFRAGFHPSWRHNTTLLQRWRAEFPPGTANAQMA
jgi:predicted metal-dependent hydrolase